MALFGFFQEKFGDQETGAELEDTRPPREPRGDRGPRRDGEGRGDRGPRRDGGDRGPRREGDRDRGPRSDRGREGGDRSDRGPRRDRDGGERNDGPSEFSAPAFLTNDRD